MGFPFEGDQVKLDCFVVFPQLLCCVQESSNGVFHIGSDVELFLDIKGLSILRFHHEGPLLTKFLSNQVCCDSGERQAQVITRSLH